MPSTSGFENWPTEQDAPALFQSKEATQRNLHMRSMWANRLESRAAISRRLWVQAQRLGLEHRTAVRDLAIAAEVLVGRRFTPEEKHYRFALLQKLAGKETISDNAECLPLFAGYLMVTGQTLGYLDYPKLSSQLYLVTSKLPLHERAKRVLQRQPLPSYRRMARLEPLSYETLLTDGWFEGFEHTPQEGLELLAGEAERQLPQLSEAALEITDSLQPEEAGLASTDVGIDSLLTLAGVGLAVRHFRQAIKQRFDQPYLTE